MPIFIAAFSGQGTSGKCQKIAEEKGNQFIVCIDEFQNISEFKEHLSFQKKLRSNWQKHQNTAYCLYGSKRHLLMNVFTSSSMPFYKFDNILFLEKIKEKEWTPSILCPATGPTNLVQDKKDL